MQSPRWGVGKEEKRGSRFTPGRVGRTAHSLERRSVLCACTYPILCEVQKEGGRLGSLKFFDDGSESETRGERVSRCPGCGRKLELHLLRAQPPRRSSYNAPPLLLSLFTRLLRRGILGNSDAASCIVLAHRAGGNGLPPVRGILIETTCWGVGLRCAFSVRVRVPGCGRVNSPTICGGGAVGSPRSAGPHSVGYVGPSEALR